ncbi:alpha/beta-hydrolase family protein [Streptomyces sp. 900116325]|uniref:alpha/beta-hydrolase family protein n=1 Tax=Streptomyces sp. 900116325 TaxID=3154295 RepID=UPI0033AFE5CD
MTNAVVNGAQPAPFWQATTDLSFTTDVPDGHRHTCRAEYVDDWNTVLRPSCTTERDLVRLRGVMSQGAPNSNRLRVQSVQVRTCQGPAVVAGGSGSPSNPRRGGDRYAVRTSGARRPPGGRRSE